MTESNHEQTTLYRGIYEFEDPSGCLVAAKIPSNGSADLYDGTAVIVRPNQCVMFIHKGQVADLFSPGTHTIKSENVPILSKLANWKFGFTSPLRSELIFFSGQNFTSRRWGTPQPVMTNFNKFGIIPIRAYGNFTVSVSNPPRFFTKLMGTRSTFSITDIEDFIQGQILEMLPPALKEVTALEELSASYEKISKKLELAISQEMKDYGLYVQKIQILSAVPSKEVLEAMEAKTAISIIGSQKEYLAYKAANSLGSGSGTPTNPLEVMMGLMLGKGVLEADYHEKEAKLTAAGACTQCGTKLQSEWLFCSKCGKRV